MTPALRVGYLLWTFPGRSETFIASEISAVRRSGASVRAFAARSEPGLPPASVATVYAPARPSWSALFGGLGRLRYAARLATDRRELLKSWWLAVRLKDSVTEFAPDVLHTHFANHPTLVALILSDWLNVPVTAMFHANDYLVGVRPAALAARVAELAQVCTISNSARAEIARRADVAESAIALVRAAVAGELMDRPPAQTSQPRIVSVARLVPKKGHRHLLDGFAELVGRGDRDTELVLVGDGPELAGLRSRIEELGLSDRVRLTGALEHAAALDLLWTARVAALTAVVAPGGDADGIPVFLMEAAAARRAIVSTPVGGVTELITDGVSGRLLTELDPAAVADALQSALSPLGSQWGEAARNRLEAEFDPDRQAERLREIWVRVLDRPEPGRALAHPAGWSG